MPCAHTTQSGIKVSKVVRRLMDEKEKLGWTNRPAITNFYSSRDIDGAMHEVLEDIFGD